MRRAARPAVSPMNNRSVMKRQFDEGLSYFYKVYLLVAFVYLYAVKMNVLKKFYLSCFTKKFTFNCN